jgi:phage protein D
LTYQGVNITANVSPMVSGITYCDRLSGGAGEVEVALEDHQRLWQSDWSPQAGDRINLLLGYEGEPLLPCGDFQVDELELSGPPDSMRIRCLEAWITPAMRTRKSVAYEGQTVSEIAATVARKYSLTVVGNANTPNVLFERVTQKQETDLEFLQRIARAHGYYFTVRGTQMVFFAITTLEGAGSTLALTRPDVLTFAFVNKTHEIYKASQVSYQFPGAKKTITQMQVGAPQPATGDTLKLEERCENGPQALLKAQSRLHDVNSLQRTVRLVTPGSTTLAAGNVVTLSGFGVNDGGYLIETARHRLARATGYTTEIQARQLNPSSPLPA